MRSQPMSAVAGQNAEFTAGELLAEGERRARPLLGRNSRAAGPTLVSGWPDVLRAAAEVLELGDSHRHLDQAYHPARQLRTHQAGALIGQLALEAAAVRGPQVPTVTHPALLRIIASWQQASALLHRPSPTEHLGQLDQPAQAAAHAAVVLRVTLRVTRTLAVRT